jgi:hypothetical protein
MKLKWEYDDLIDCSVSLCSEARLGSRGPLRVAYLLGIANQQLLGVAQHTSQLLLSRTCVTCRVPVRWYRCDKKPQTVKRNRAHFCWAVEVYIRSAPYCAVARSS